MIRKREADFLYRDITVWQKKMRVEVLPPKVFFYHTEKEQRSIYDTIRNQYIRFRAEQTRQEMNKKFNVSLKVESDDLTEWVKVWFPNVDR